ncbi:MAG: acyl-CoA dehydrogenase family protein [Hyphomicrobiaceae bacterium]
MSTELDPIIAEVRRFAENTLWPAATRHDEEGLWVGAHLPTLSALGLMGANLPADFGGAGIGPHLLAEVVAAVASACPATASMLTAHYLATDAILLGGTPEQREDLLPRMAAGALGAFALTEPEAGSNPQDMTSRAERKGAAYRLKGAKQFISNAGRAEIIVLFAKTDPEAGSRGISAFAVPRATPGLDIGPPERTMGLKGAHVFPLAFDMEVPSASRLGDEGSGFKTAMRVLDNGRLEVAAMAIGIARRALALATHWAKARQVGGRPLADNQGIQWMLANMVADLAAAEALSREATARRATDSRFSRESAIAKLVASEMAGRVTDQALQIHGGYGYTRDLALERLARDARILRIYEGASEIQRTIIARDILANGISR